MKKSLKRILIVLGSLVAIAAIVAGSVYGTIAYLTASSKVSNVFTVGNVYLTMFESKVDADGKATAALNPGNDQPGYQKTSDGNSYHLVPGSSYDKDPTIYIQANSESSYLFVLVRNDIRPIEDKTDATNKPTMMQQMEKQGWVQYPYAAPSMGTSAWIYHGLDENGNVNTEPMGVVGGANGNSVDLFTKFHIDKNADVSLYGGAGVEVRAIGIQTKGFADGVDAEGKPKNAEDFAWDAVVATYPFIYDSLHGTVETETQAPANP